MAYTIEEHRHRFGVWAAARAAQRRLRGGGVKVLGAALERSGVPETVSGDPSAWPSTAAEFDERHRLWCAEVRGSFARDAGEELSYGRAAKLIAIYLKATVVNAGFEETPFARVIHPPIDRILLRSLAKLRSVEAAHRKLWASVNWTELDERGYFELIDSLRAAGLAGDSFWKIEQHWTPQG